MRLGLADGSSTIGKSKAAIKRNVLASKATSKAITSLADKQTNYRNGPGMLSIGPMICDVLRRWTAASYDFRYLVRFITIRGLLGSHDRPKVLSNKMRLRHLDEISQDVRQHVRLAD